MPALKPWMSALAGLVVGAGLIALLPAASLFHTGHDHVAAADDHAGERWACPMMDYVGTKPGKCPVCGMTLVLVKAGELSAENARRIGLQTSPVVMGPAVASVHAYGAADYDHRFSQLIIARVAGRIVKRYDATLGHHQEIAAGDPIVELYSPEVIAAQGELQAAIKLGDATLVASLRERFARWNLDDVADALVKGGALRDTVTIRSPFAGQILLKDQMMLDEGLAIGREVMPDMPLLRIMDPDRLVLIVHVPETRARWVAEGQPVKIDSDDLGPLPQLHAVVARVAAEIDTGTRAREVRIHISGARKLLFPGSLVNARFQAALAPDLSAADYRDRSTWGQFALVPKTSVLSTGVRNVVWKVAERAKGGFLRFELASVALGPRLEDENGNDLYVIRAGLSAGDEVATQGAFLIDSQAQLAGTPSLLYPLGAAEAAPAAHVH